MAARPWSQEDQALAREAEQKFTSGDYLNAAKICSDLAQRHNDNPTLLHLYAASLSAIGHFDGAREVLERFVKLAEAAGNPPQLPLPIVYHDLANVYVRLSRLADAEALLAKGLNLWPADPAIARARAELLAHKGDWQGAYDAIRPLVESGSRDVALALAMALVAPRVNQVDRAIEHVTTFVDDPRLPDALRAELGFRLASLYEAGQQWDVAFQAADAANQRSRHATYDPEAYEAAVDRIIRTWTRPVVERLPRASARTEVPVFIVGMPRSGTTLVEHIVSGHPQVHAGGEIRTMSRVVAEVFGPASVPGLPDIPAPESVTRELVDRAADSYLSAITKLNPEASRITDKVPMNFERLGLIALMFPECRVIHCIRNPLDTCVSCYFRDFVGHYPYSYRLEHLGHYHGLYQRLMDHWKSVLDLSILDVRYEHVVADQEAQSRRMIDFLGLPWDDACLRYHEKAAGPASIHQARKPVYATSVERFRRYDPHLGPLRRALGIK